VKHTKRENPAATQGLSENGHLCRGQFMVKITHGLSALNKMTSASHHMAVRARSVGPGTRR
jgi:hypothetical protein